MKHRLHFTDEQKEAILLRDGPMCALGCGRMAVDVDHAFRKSGNLPHIDEIWNANLLDRICHVEVTAPDTYAKWMKALKVMELALHRAYDEFGGSNCQEYYHCYKSKVTLDVLQT